MKLMVDFASVHLTTTYDRTVFVAVEEAFSCETHALLPRSDFPPYFAQNRF